MRKYLVWSACILLVISCKQANIPDKAPGIYEPSLASIRQHKSPEWFDDAKFGMFIDWGIYSVPGWGPKNDENKAIYPDWYLKYMYEKPEWIRYHNETWGEDFERDDFIPLFTAENYDPELLAGIAEEAGMKYVIPFCKHHDGFCLWPSSFTNRDAADMGPEKDLIKPLIEACKSRNLKFGFYFSLEEWEYPLLENGKPGKIRLWESGKPQIRIEEYDAVRFKGMLTGKIPVKHFYGDYILPQAKEFIDMYDPDILWFDGDWHTPVKDTRTPELISYFYNKAAGRKEVACNDRLGLNLRYKIGDFYTSEYHSLESEQSKFMHKWEECRGISQSFGYNWQDTEESVITVDEFIDMFIRIVSENGNLLLIVNLDGKGALPEVQTRRLREIGSWLKVNGEAIYGSRPWLVSKEGENIRFTQSKDGKYVYAICNQWPKDELRLKTVYPGSEKAEVRLLGTHINLDWYIEQVIWGDMVIRIPENLIEHKLCDYAYVFRIDLH